MTLSKSKTLIVAADLQRPWIELSRKLTMDLHGHIEEFAAAYLMQTKIPPDKAVMVIQGDIFTGMRIWFEEKKDNEPESS